MDDIERIEQRALASLSSSSSSSSSSRSSSSLPQVRDHLKRLFQLLFGKDIPAEEQNKSKELLPLLEDVADELVHILVTNKDFHNPSILRKFEIAIFRMCDAKQMKQTHHGFWANERPTKPLHISQEVIYVLLCLSSFQSIPHVYEMSETLCQEHLTYFRAWVDFDMLKPDNDDHIVRFYPRDFEQNGLCVQLAKAIAEYLYLYDFISPNNKYSVVFSYKWTVYTECEDISLDPPNRTLKERSHAGGLHVFVTQPLAFRTKTHLNPLASYKPKCRPASNLLEHVKNTNAGLFSVINNIYDGDCVRQIRMNFTPNARKNNPSVYVPTISLAFTGKTYEPANNGTENFFKSLWAEHGSAPHEFPLYDYFNFPEVRIPEQLNTRLQMVRFFITAACTVRAGINFFTKPTIIENAIATFDDSIADDAIQSMSEVGDLLTNIQVHAEKFQRLEDARFPKQFNPGLSQHFSADFAQRCVKRMCVNVDSQDPTNTIVKCTTFLLTYINQYFARVGPGFMHYRVMKAQSDENEEVFELTRTVITLKKDDILTLLNEIEYPAAIAILGTKVSITWKPYGPVWIRNPKKRSYQRACFFPGSLKGSDFLNTWTGFKRTYSTSYLASLNSSAKANAQGIFNWMKIDMLSADSDLFDFIMECMYLKYVKPSFRFSFIVLIMGDMGTGKKFLCRIVQAFFAPFSQDFPDTEYLFTRFGGGHLANTILVIAMECKKLNFDSAIFRSFVSEGKVSVEIKGVQQAYGDQSTSTSSWGWFCANLTDHVHLPIETRRLLCIRNKNNHQRNNTLFSTLDALLRDKQVMNGVCQLIYDHGKKAFEENQKKPNPIDFRDPIPNKQTTLCKLECLSGFHAWLLEWLTQRNPFLPPAKSNITVKEHDGIGMIDTDRAVSKIQSALGAMDLDNRSWNKIWLLEYLYASFKGKNSQVSKESFARHLKSFIGPDGMYVFSIEHISHSDYGDLEIVRTYSLFAIRKLFCHKFLLKEEDVFPIAEPLDLTCPLQVAWEKNINERIEVNMRSNNIYQGLFNRECTPDPAITEQEEEEEEDAPQQQNTVFERTSGAITAMQFKTKVANFMQNQDCDEEGKLTLLSELSRFEDQFGQLLFQSSRELLTQGVEEEVPGYYEEEEEDLLGLKQINNYDDEESERGSSTSSKKRRTGNIFVDD
ncbi:MAG: hypothetical protein UY48_C0041G0004 [Candidatus Gottesmanbacteria bacterium GW2011_GWB1_49_7]|uniref:Uncharacterized protein n=1 Tax=Candidatus Gottesmanbacteria bacterium GW2011_GWB1_49_7 TaxID=1618448 RepID=A0A0G1VVH3_9BACT|nr:MAG: hypothetical protein UY48_C0041G0004 [Candidatus Gottesmanbacteria bacterium GW2011_GWB1_49_7]